MQGGFEISIRNDGHLSGCVFEPTANASRLVSYAVDGAGTVAIVVGRIFYRRELPQRSRRGDVSTESDAEIALAAYRTSGERGLAQLEGEFSVVVVDRFERRVLVRRDPLGTFPLYWTSNADVLRVGTSLRSLCDGTAGSRIDRNYLAALIAFPFAFVEPPQRETVFEGMHRVRAGEMLSLRCDGSADRLDAWDWKNQVESVEDLTFQEAADEFKRRLSAAVLERSAAGRVGAHLSGGMDSSSIACLARDQLAKEKGQRELPAFSLAYNSPALAPERAFIDDVCRQPGSIAPHFLPGDDALHFDWFRGDGIPDHDEPYAGLFELASQSLVAEAAENAGVSSILTGVGIELFLEGGRHRTGDLLRRGRLFAAAKEANRYATALNISPATALFGELKRLFLPRALREGVGPILRGGYGTWPNVGLFTVPPWIRRDFARTFRLRKRALATLEQTDRFPREKHSEFFGLNTAVGDWAGWYLCGSRGIRVSHPFLDPRVVGFVLGLPRDFKGQPGNPKRLLREAMRGCLPESIRNRRFKRGFNDVYWRGLSRNLPALEAMVRESPIDQLEILDKPKFIEILRNHAMGTGDAMTGGRISTMLSIVAWYAQVDRQPAVPTRRMTFNKTSRHLDIESASRRKRGHNSMCLTSDSQQ